MPSYTLGICSSSIAFTKTHYWYSHHRELRRRSLATHVDELIHTFDDDIDWLQIYDGTRCVAATHGVGGADLWVEPSWERFATRVTGWYVLPTRVVYSDTDGCIMIFDFVRTSLVARGILLGASDHRILYANRGYKWQDGASAADVSNLLMNDVAILRGQVYNKPKRAYRAIRKDGKEWLECDSRTRIRLQRFLNAAPAAQLLQHA